MASSPLIQDHYPCPSHHGNRKTSGRAHQTGALNQEGDQLLVLSNQALPAPLHLAYISLLIATYSLATRRQMQLSHSPPPAPSFSLPPAFHFIFSYPLCPPLSAFSLTMPVPSVYSMVGLLGRKDGDRTPAGHWFAYLVSMLNREQETESLSRD